MGLQRLQKQLGCETCKFADLDLLKQEDPDGCCKAPVSFGDVLIENHLNEAGRKVYSCRKYQFDETRATA